MSPAFVPGLLLITAQLVTHSGTKLEFKINTALENSNETQNRRERKQEGVQRHSTLDTVGGRRRGKLRQAVQPSPAQRGTYQRRESGTVVCLSPAWGREGGPQVRSGGQWVLPEPAMGPGKSQLSCMALSSPGPCPRSSFLGHHGKQGQVHSQSRELQDPHSRNPVAQAQGPSSRPACPGISAGGTQGEEGKEVGRTALPHAFQLLC